MSQKPKVLIVYTGGTIGMIRDVQSGELKSFDFQQIYAHVPELQRLNVEISVESFKIPVDSSEMNTVHWVDMGRSVFENYDKYDGFVILHGSDTMAYSASALSFMLQGLKKPVIFTGSQLPIGTLRTDGKENLVTAIEIAAHREKNEALVQEVAVYFEYSLYRGNRCSKVSANQFEAFQSPNYPELAVAGVEIEYRTHRLFRTTEKKLKFYPELENNIALVKLFPGMPMSSYRPMFDPTRFKGVIMETFGSGNAPSHPEFQDMISNFIQQGGAVLNVTQCSSGKVEQGKYETSSFFNKAGVISGGEMTTETALVKMMHLLANEKNIDGLRERLAKDLVGEMN